jgi:hypothetical protein
MKIPPQQQWIGPVVRTAVELNWQEATRTAIAQQGDDSLVSEMMERAIDRTVNRLADGGPIGVEDACTILRHFYSLEVRRRRDASKRLSYPGSALESMPDITAANDFTHAEAKLDLEAMLRDTRPEVRIALLMRYGSCARWSEVADRMATTEDAVRKSCRRELKRIRQRLGIPDRST